MYGEIMFKDESYQSHTSGQAKDDLAFKCEIGNNIVGEIGVYYDEISEVTQSQFNFCLERMKNAVESGVVEVPAGLNREERRKFLEERGEEINEYRVNCRLMKDEEAVDRFAVAMKDRMSKARLKGRHGWNDPLQCSIERLADLLVGNLSKGNPGTFEDIANFAMMLYHRGADTSCLAFSLRKYKWDAFNREVLNKEEVNTNRVSYKFMEKDDE